MNESSEPLLLKSPSPITNDEKSVWTVLAWNKRVLRSWEALCDETTEDAIRCIGWLNQNAMTRIPKRCFPLRGKVYAGVWEYEIGRGNRVFYIPNASEKTVYVYYAGKHISPAPFPPRISLAALS